MPADDAAPVSNAGSERSGPAVAIRRQRMKVPHMGWNTLTWERDDPLFSGLSQECYVYFVHGYYPVPVESADCPIKSAVCDYGLPFCASIWRENLWATQFHPEKSQQVGMAMLANFANF